MTTTSIIDRLSEIPNESSVIQDGSNVVSIPYERFLHDLQTNGSSLQKRAFNYLTRNPDFNLLSANGTNPVTQASPNDTEILDKWFVQNGGGGNTFTFTPTAFGATTPSITGSLYHLGMEISALDSPLYLYNQELTQKTISPLP